MGLEETLPDPPPGSEARGPAFLGKYEVEARLGAGGQGAVYRVRNPLLGRVEALKILREDREAAEVERFEREARVLAGLRHPNVVPIFEVGFIDGRPYYTMEYLEGESVAGVLKRAGALAPRAAARVARDAARALAAAHERGVVHRDLKPHNLLVCPDPHGEAGEPLPLAGGPAGRARVLLTDFGLARVAGERSLTRESGMILGTLLYMAPEQAGGGRADAWSDVYGLGASLYHIATGRPPFESGTAAELLRRIASEEPPPPRAVAPGLPRDLETIILRCMSKAPEGRYPGAAAVAADLDRFLRDEPIAARREGPGRRLRSGGRSTSPAGTSTAPRRWEVAWRSGSPGATRGR